jgi:hypothetical protein
MRNAKDKRRTQSSPASRPWSCFKVYIAVGFSFFLGFSFATFLATPENLFGADDSFNMKDSMVDGGGARVDDRHGGDLTTTRYMNHTGSTSTTTSSTGTSTTTKRVGHRKPPSHNDILNELNMLSGGHRSQEDLKCPHPLIPFHNKMIRTNQTSNSAGTSTNQEIKIPKILHVSMRSRCLPRDLIRSMDRWKETLPNYSIIFHDDEAVARLIEQDWPQFPELHTAMRCILYKGAMRIDIWRILILYKYGGVYTDIDNWPTDAFQESTIRSDLSGFFFHDGRERPSQWFMAVEPVHPFMHLAISHIIQNVLDMIRLPKPMVTLVTGPNAVKNAYVYFLAPTCCNNGNSTNLQEEIFANDVVMTGIMEKQVIKISAEEFVTSKYQYDEIVPYNATLNVTRGERIAMDSGVGHWETTNFRAAKWIRELLPQKKFQSCRNYIWAVDNGYVKAIDPI